MDNIRWKVTDPLGNEIHLTEENFFNNSGQPQLEPQLKFIVKHPRFVIKHKIGDGRRSYLDLVDLIQGDAVTIRAVEIVVDGGKIVTWFVRRTINDVLDKGDVIYDERNNDLQV